MPKISIKNPFPMSIKKIFLISGMTIILGVSILVILAIIFQIRINPPEDFYELEGNKITAYESVIGKCNGNLCDSPSDILEYAYERSKTSEEDARRYAQFLCENDGFSIDDDSSRSVAVYRDAVQEGKVIRLVVTFPADGAMDHGDVGVQMKLFNETDTKIYVKDQTA